MLRGNLRVETTCIPEGKESGFLCCSKWSLQPQCSECLGQDGQPGWEVIARRRKKGRREEGKGGREGGREEIRKEGREEGRKSGRGEGEKKGGREGEKRPPLLGVVVHARNPST